MSQLILDWLNQDVRLSRKVGAFERDFANGFLFGELLYKNGLLTSFEDEFVDDKRLAAKRKNFELLAKALRCGQASCLGIRLKDEHAAEIMDEDRGASLRLLYQLRRGLSGKATRTSDAPRSEAGGEADHRLLQTRKGEFEEQFFDRCLKNVRTVDDAYRYEVHNKHFIDAHTRNMQHSRA